MRIKDDCEVMDLNTYLTKKITPIKAADMVTKPPFEHNEKVYILGRRHLHVFNTETKSFTLIKGMGEDKAEEIAKEWDGVIRNRED